MNIESILIVVAFFSLIGWSCLSMSKQAGDIYAALDAFTARAEQAQTWQELKAIDKELITYANKYCVMKPFGSAAEKVHEFIRGKYSGMNPQESLLS